jgi:hypothetical protein
MIQRVQSIWMFLASVAVFLTLVLPFFGGLTVDNVQHWVMPQDQLLLLILTCSLGSLLLVNIFMFKHRNWQIKICLFAIFVECTDIFLLIREDNRLHNGNFTLWSALHLLIVFFLIKASIDIYRDEKLVRDSNRLR